MLDKTNYIDKKISKLSEELGVLNNSYKQEVYNLVAQNNGVFVNFTDGYESEFNNNLQIYNAMIIQLINVFVKGFWFLKRLQG